MTSCTEKWQKKKKKTKRRKKTVCNKHSLDNRGHLLRVSYSKHTCLLLKPHRNVIFYVKAGKALANQRLLLVYLLNCLYSLQEFNQSRPVWQAHVHTYHTCCYGIVPSISHMLTGVAYVESVSTPLHTATFISNPNKPVAPRVERCRAFLVGVP